MLQIVLELNSLVTTEDVSPSYVQDQIQLHAGAVEERHGGIIRAEEAKGGGAAQEAPQS